MNQQNIANTKYRPNSCLWPSRKKNYILQGFLFYPPSKPINLNTTTYKNKLYIWQPLCNYFCRIQNSIQCLCLAHCSSKDDIESFPHIWLQLLSLNAIHGNNLVLVTPVINNANFFFWNPTFYKFSLETRGEDNNMVCQFIR